MKRQTLRGWIRHISKLAKPISIALLAGFLILGCSGGGKQPNPSGTLEAERIDIGATLPARVVQVRVEEGQRVSAGDTLVVLDTELLRLQRAQTEANRAALAAQRRVAEANLAQASAGHDLQRVTFERMSRLVEQGNVTRQQYDEAASRLQIAATQVSAAQNQLAALAAEEVKLDAGLDVMNHQIAEGIITAPAAGTILLKNVRPGEVVGPTGTVVRMADLSSLDLRVYLEIGDVDRLRLGDSLDVLVDALGGKVLKGRVAWISEEAEFTPKNAQTRNARAQLVYAVRVSVPNRGGNLHIGMPAEVRLPGGTEK